MKTIKINDDIDNKISLTVHQSSKFQTAKFHATSSKIQKSNWQSQKLNETYLHSSQVPGVTFVGIVYVYGYGTFNLAETLAHLDFFSLIPGY